MTRKKSGKCTIYPRIYINGSIHLDIPRFIRTGSTFIVCVQMIPAVQQFIVASMGHRYIEPPTFDLSLSYRESTHSTPLIFILSPGADPLAVLMKFAEERGFYCHHSRPLMKQSAAEYSFLTK
jgi:hypothetical protein